MTEQSAVEVSAELVFHRARVAITDRISYLSQECLEVIPQRNAHADLLVEASDRSAHGHEPGRDP